MLARHDARLSRHLVEEDVQFQFFGIRWLTTLLTREFELPDAVRVWDSLLAEEAVERCRYAQCVCVAMLMSQRDALLGGDFAACVKILQGGQDRSSMSQGQSVERILDAAERVRAWEFAPPEKRGDVPPQPYSGGEVWSSAGAASGAGALTLPGATTVNLASVSAGAKAFFQDVRAAAQAVGKQIAEL